MGVYRSTGPLVLPQLFVAGCDTEVRISIGSIVRPSVCQEFEFSDSCKCLFLRSNCSCSGDKVMK